VIRIHWLVLVAVGSFLFGSLPVGLWVGLLWKGIDVRQLGSGNIGATNVVRVLGWKPGIVVFVGDLAKGLLPVLLATQAISSSVVVALCGVCAVAGHSFSPFLGFRGGRGVATSLGVLFALSWKVALSAFGVWLVMLAALRIVSVASVAAAVSLPIWVFVLGEPAGYQVFALPAMALVVLRHTTNIRRLMQGKEPRLGRG
jgi:glycerol-3-phosphate acyltransferase PlsY